VAPRSEAGDSATSKSETLLGAQEFELHEQKIKEQIQRLVSERASLVSNHSEDTYRLGRGDVLEFDVFGLPNLRTEVEISPSGGAQFPLLQGEVYLVGKSLHEAKRDLAGRLARYIKNPQIKLVVTQYQGNKVAISGAVAKPGMYALRRGAPLVSEMISEAGGRTDKAGNRIIISANSGTSGSVEVDYEDLIGSAEQAPLIIPVMNGDTIIVPEAGTFEVEGEVKAPGSYKITGRKTVMGSIAAAGGFGFAARVHEVELIRDIGAGKKAYIVLNLEDIALRGKDDVRVRDGDLIRVPTESGRHVQRQVVEALNSIFRGFGFQGQVN
jgi:polysaccharide export outer membrane protein